MASHRSLADAGSLRYTGKTKTVLWKVNISIQRGIENIVDQYAIESDTLKAYMFRMVKLYHYITNHLV
jgi:hypothetical protein